MGEPLRAEVASLRATRWFADTPVPTREIVRALEAARWTGSARNRQPWRFVVVRDGALRERLSLLGGYAAHLATAPVAVLLAVDHATGGEDAEFDAGRAAQSLMLAAHGLGLGSCPVSFFPASNAERAGRLALRRGPVEGADGHRARLPRTRAPRQIRDPLGTPAAGPAGPLDRLLM